MKSMLITNYFFPYLFSLFFFGVKSKETVGNSWTVLKVILGRKYRSKSFKTWQCCPPHLSVASFSQPAALTTLLWPFVLYTGAPAVESREPSCSTRPDWRPQCRIPCSVQNYYYPFKSLTTIPILIRVSAGSDMAPPTSCDSVPGNSARLFFFSQ